LSGCIQIAGTPLLPADSTVASQSPEPPVERRVTHGIVGEKLSAGAWVVTVEAAKRSGDKSVGDAKPVRGSEFLAIDVGFENKGTDALEVRAGDFELVGPAGRALPMADMTQPAFNARSMRLLLPRFGTSTVFVYRVPKGTEHYTFAFTPQGAGGTRLEWRLP
jgi:hypothetical protein